MKAFKQRVARDISPTDHTMTTGYTGAGAWVSEWVDVSDLTDGMLLLTFEAQGTPTSVLLVMETSRRGGTPDAADDFEVWKVASGVAALNETTITYANLPTDKRIGIPVSCRGDVMIRFRAKYSGGSAEDMRAEFIGGAP